MNNTNKAFVGLLASMYFANDSHALAPDQTFMVQGLLFEQKHLLERPADVPESLADEVTLRWNLVNGRKKGTNFLSYKE